MLDSRLKGDELVGHRDYLAGKGGGKFSAADVVIWPWVNVANLCGLGDTPLSRFPCLVRWWVRIKGRAGVVAGCLSKYEV